MTDLESTARVIDMITGTGFTMAGYPVRSLFSMDFQGLNEEGLPTFINEKGELTVSDIDFQERDNKGHLVCLLYTSGSCDEGSNLQRNK